MSEEIVPQPTAQPVIADPGTADPQPAVIPESAPGTPVEGEPQIPAEPGTEPEATPPQEPEEAKLVQEVIKLRRRAQEAEREASYLKGLNDSKQTQPQQQQVPKKQGVPDVNDYEDYDQFIVDKAKFELLQDQRDNKERDRLAKVDLDYQGRLSKAVKENPELEEKIRAADRLPIHDSVAMAIKESDVGPQIVGYLANNPQEALRMAGLSATSALKEVGKIEARITMKPEPIPKKQVTQAPSPITPTSGKGGAVKNVDNMSVAEHIAYYNDQDRKKGLLK